MRAVSGPKQIDLSFVGIGQLAAVTGPDHLRTACLADSGAAGKMFEITRAAWVCHIHDRRAVRFHQASHGIHRSPTMMTYVSNKAVALLVNDWLIGGTRLQVVETDKPHILRLGRAADCEHGANIKGE